MDDRRDSGTNQFTCMKRNKYMNAGPGYQHRTDKPKPKRNKHGENIWHKAGIIWRTLAQYEGLTVRQIVTLTGLAPSLVHVYLTRRMAGVRCSGWNSERGGRLWHAEGANLNEWQEVLL